MKDPRLLSEEELDRIRESVPHVYGCLLDHIDAIQARTSPDPMLVEAQWLVSHGEPFYGLRDDQLGDWWRRQRAWLTRYDATHGGTPASSTETPKEQS